MATDKPAAPIIKLPKSPAAVADLMYSTRHERFQLQQQVSKLEAIEKACGAYLIEQLPKTNATGIAGKLVRASLEKKDIVIVTDWDAVYDYILKNARKNPGVWAVMQKRIGDSAVKDMRNNKKPCPGTDLMQVDFVSLNKL
jgi:hypothetical protein